MSLPPAQAPIRATGCGSARTSRSTSAAASSQSRARHTTWDRIGCPLPPGCGHAHRVEARRDIVHPHAVRPGRGPPGRLMNCYMCYVSV